MPESLTREEIVKRLEELAEQNPEKWAAAVLDVLNHLETEYPGPTAQFARILTDQNSLRFGLSLMLYATGKFLRLAFDED